MVDINNKNIPYNEYFSLSITLKVQYSYQIIKMNINLTETYLNVS